MTTPLAISYDDVAAAHTRLAGIAHRTPVFTSRTADERSGATLYFKCENLQRIGASPRQWCCPACSTCAASAWASCCRAAT